MGNAEAFEVKEKQVLGEKRKRECGFLGRMGPLMHCLSRALEVGVTSTRDGNIGSWVRMKHAQEKAGHGAPHPRHPYDTNSLRIKQSVKMKTKKIKQEHG